MSANEPYLGPRMQVADFHTGRKPHVVYCCAFMDVDGDGLPGWGVWFPRSPHFNAASRLPEFLAKGAPCPHRASLYAILMALQIAQKDKHLFEDGLEIYTSFQAAASVNTIALSYLTGFSFPSPMADHFMFYRDVDLLAAIACNMQKMRVDTKPLAGLETGTNDNNKWGKNAKSGLHRITVPRHEDGTQVFRDGIPIALLPDTEANVDFERKLHRKIDHVLEHHLSMTRAVDVSSLIAHWPVDRGLPPWRMVDRASPPRDLRPCSSLPPLDHSMVMKAQRDHIWGIA